ncbi:MAG: cation-translocating P-type ATPase [Nitrospirae bacterium]|nr:cation-translocating P-type ATPase [Nitrospirota bacterium]MCL5421665.1 cation-translocating P-type ATPase [Nitrospirota bacterium]
MNELFRDRKVRWLLAALLAIVPFEILSLFSIHLPLWIELPLLIAVIVVFGRKVFIGGIRSLMKLNFADIDLLMTIAVLGALYLRQFEEAAIIVVLFALGETLEEFGVERSQAALKGLIDKTPKSARIKEKNEEVPIEDVEIGEIMIIKPGDQIPLDGEIIFGNSLLDEATITGEPLPASKYIGDTVYAGTVNMQGYLEAKVIKKAKDSALAKIIELTFRFAEKKASSQKFIERFAEIYTPSIVIASLLLILIPVALLGKPLDPWLTQALTLLIIACPCALVISTPIAIFSAVGNATGKGVLIKGGRFIEEMGKVQAIAFDKTRTLTKGEPVISDVVPFNGFTEEEVIACAAGMETFSEHPIARGILDKSKKLGVRVHEYENFRAIPGKGLKGECMVCFDKHHCMGNIKFVTEEHAVEEPVLKKVEEFEEQGKTAIVISDNKRVKGIIGVADEIREESKPLIDRLLKMNIVPIILTGDNKAAAGFVAAHLGIGVVKAELLPSEKVEELSGLIQQHRHVAMVGDGVNDAPALATASVGIAMGAIGSDVAIENADVALMNDKLGLVAYLVGLGRACAKKIRYNIASAVTVKFLFLFLAMAGLSNLAMAIFADVGVTVLVIMNSLRLFGYEDR